jgi:hypothetical protein
MGLAKPWPMTPLSAKAPSSVGVEETTPELSRMALVRIIAYLRSHPLARDTARWIAQFWAKASLQAVDSALQFLTQRGFLRTSRINGEVLYSRNPDYPWKDLQRLVRDFTLRG